MSKKPSRGWGWVQLRPEALVPPPPSYHFVILLAQGPRICQLVEKMAWGLLVYNFLTRG